MRFHPAGRSPCTCCTPDALASSAHRVKIRRKSRAPFPHTPSVPSRFFETSPLWMRVRAGVRSHLRIPNALGDCIYLSTHFMLPLRAGFTLIERYPDAGDGMAGCISGRRAAPPTPMSLSRAADSLRAATQLPGYRLLAFTKEFSLHKRVPCYALCAFILVTANQSPSRECLRDEIGIARFQRCLHTSRDYYTCAKSRGIAYFDSK